MTTASSRLGEILVSNNLITQDELQAYLAREASAGQPLAQLLLADGRITEKQLLRALAGQVGLPFFDLGAQPVNPEAVGLVPAELAHRFTLVGVGFDGERLLCAMADPHNAEAINALQTATGRLVAPALADRTELANAVTRLYPMAAPQPSLAAQMPPRPGGDGGVIRDERLLEAAAAVAAPSVQVGAEASQYDLEQMHVNDLLVVALERGASDLHLTVGTPPQIRINGDLTQLPEFPVLRPQPLRKMLYAILTQKQRERLEEELELDMSHPLPGRARFRVNMFFQRDAIGSVMRVIPMDILPLEKLGIPPVAISFGRLPRGLVLVTGPTGSGKSTTLASILDIINRDRPVHIMTVEDPIEFLHTHKRAVVNQREVGEDTHGFSEALKHVLRQDPDVILVGEMRDLETIATALTAAETGHLVFGTLHTQDAPQSIDRVIDVFPPHQQQQVRTQLAASIQAVMTQDLLQTSDGRGRVPAIEVMIATPAIRNLIREGKTHQIYSAMQAGGKFGMQTKDQALADLVQKRRITLELARERCANEEDLMRLMGRA